MGNAEDEEPHADIVIMGEQKVGKTALVHRLLGIEDSASLKGRYKATIEDSFVRQYLVGEYCCRLRFVDTAGGYAFPAMQRLWVKKASAFVLVCARNDSQSLQHVRNILSRIREERTNDLQRLLLVLVVNKCDVHMKYWTVLDEHVESLADEYGLPYSSIVFASALTGINVMEILYTLWRQNGEAGERAIAFAPRASASQSNRRSSAFAVLFGGPSWSKERKVTPPAETGRAHAGSFGDNILPGTRRLQSMSNGSPKWFMKTFGLLNNPRLIKSRNKHDGSPNVIDMNCNVS